MTNPTALDHILAALNCTTKVKLSTLTPAELANTWVAAFGESDWDLDIAENWILLDDKSTDPLDAVLAYTLWRLGFDSEDLTPSDCARLARKECSVDEWVTEWHTKPGRTL
jgi:hypothetical protein